MKFTPKKQSKSQKRVEKSFPPGEMLFDLERDGITQGLLSDWCSCRVAAMYRLLGWRKETPTRALEMGSLFHQVLETLYKHSPKDLAYRIAFNLTAADWRRQAIEKGDDPQLVEDDLAMASSLIRAYVDMWKKQDSTRTWVQLEQCFVQTFCGFMLRGRVDGVYEDAKKNLWIFETKTTSYITEDAYGPMLQFALQPMFYGLAKGIELKRPIVGVLYNIIRKPNLKIGKDGNRSEWYKRIDADITARPDWYFKRYEVRWTDKQIAVFHDELVTKLAEFKQWLSGATATYRNQAQCVHGWTCQYLNACATRSMEGFRRDEQFRYSELEEAK